MCIYFRTGTCGTWMMCDCLVKALTKLLRGVWCEQRAPDI